MKVACGDVLLNVSIPVNAIGQSAKHAHCTGHEWANGIGCLLGHGCRFLLPNILLFPRSWHVIPDVIKRFIRCRYVNDSKKPFVKCFL